MRECRYLRASGKGGLCRGSMVRGVPVWRSGVHAHLPMSDGMRLTPSPPLGVSLDILPTAEAGGFPSQPGLQRNFRPELRGLTLHRAANAALHVLGGVPARLKRGPVCSWPRKVRYGGFARTFFTRGSFAISLASLDRSMRSMMSPPSGTADRRTSHSCVRVAHRLWHSYAPSARPCHTIS